MTVITWGSYSPSSLPSKVPPWHFFLIIKCVHITESLWGGPKNQGRKPTQQPELPQPSKWLGRSSSQWTNTSSPGDTCCLWLGIWSLIVSTDCSAYLQVCHLAEETDRPLQRAGGQWDLNAQQVQGRVHGSSPGVVPAVSLGSRPTPVQRFRISKQLQKLYF